MTECLHLKVSDRTMVFAFTTSIPHCTTDSSQGNETRKRNKRQPDWKGRNKPLRFAQDMTMYIEILKKPRITSTISSKRVHQYRRTSDQYKD